MTMAIGELIGLPGAGKTTVLRTVAGQLTIPLMDSPAATVSGRGVIDRIRIALKCPVDSLYFYGLVLSRQGVQFAQARKVYSLQKRYLAVYERPSRGNVLVDEGVVHGNFSAVFATRSTRLSRLFLRRVLQRIVGKGAHFYFLDVDRDTCMHRFRQRHKRSRFSALAEDRSAEFMSNDFYEEVVDMLRSDWPTAVTVRETTESMVAQLILDFGAK